MTGHRIVNGLVEQELSSLDKAQWTLCLSGNDPVLRIHIPPDERFDPQTVAASYDRTRNIFSQCYSDRPFKAFFCSSWLMSRNLQEILKSGSNILAFQNGFIPIPYQSSGTLVFEYVFGTGAAIPKYLSTLPEITSLQRAVKS